MFLDVSSVDPVIPVLLSAAPFSSLAEDGKTFDFIRAFSFQHLEKFFVNSRKIDLKQQRKIYFYRKPDGVTDGKDRHTHYTVT